MCEGKGLGEGKQTLEGGGRKITDEGMEEQLVPWAPSKSLRVSRELIMVKTKCLDDKTCDKSEKDVFIASNGWLQKFFHRNGLSFSRKTTTVQLESNRCPDY